MVGSGVAMIQPLCVIQARYNSKRLPGKMCLPLGGQTLIERAWRNAASIFGADNCVVAIPWSDADGPLGAELDRIDANVFPWVGPQTDVLGRFRACAHAYRWHPETVIVRWCADDWNKSPAHVRRVVAGERLPVELGAEAFTLAMLDAAHHRCDLPHQREHLTYAIFPVDPPPAPPGVWEINTEADYEAACALVEDDAAAFGGRT
jgi:spore coat polysaccharide biosynthesis protein SpsF